ncbi:twin transmembrane helix small protein [Candidatus Rariloculus sp.]|uniref:twin transmembrane helix small protein n=1 Tax=Candidatus Rariloculus sp. TaxID=3101265 RepID=UPI003D0A9CDA
MFNVIILVVMLGILVSLGSGLMFLVRDGGKTNRTVMSLTVRVGLSVLLLVLLAVGFAGKYMS